MPYFKLIKIKENLKINLEKPDVQFSYWTTSKYVWNNLSMGL